METKIEKNETAKLEETPDIQALLVKIEKNVSRQTRYSRLQFFCAALALIVFTVGLLALGMKVFPIIDQVSGTLMMVNSTIEEMKLAEMTKSITDVAKEGSVGISDALKQIDSAMEGVTGAIKVIEGLDIQGLNDGITKLNEVLEPMAKFFGRR